MGSMKIVCISCGEPAIIADHGSKTVELMGLDLTLIELTIECEFCEHIISQSLTTTGMTEEQILSHPRHYTQLP